jgi:hypothetical protein
MRQAHRYNQKHAAAILHESNRHFRPVPLTARRADGGSQTKGISLFNWGLCPQTREIGLKNYMTNSRQDKD